MTVFAYLILTGIEVFILIRLFSPFSWEYRCTFLCIVYQTSKTTFHYISNTSNFAKYFPLCVQYSKHSSPYLEVWLNTVFHAWCITSLMLQLLFVTVLKKSEQSFDIFLIWLRGFAWDTPFIREIHFCHHSRVLKSIVFAIVCSQTWTGPFKMKGVLGMSWFVATSVFNADSIWE